MLSNAFYFEKFSLLFVYFNWRDLQKTWQTYFVLILCINNFIRFWKQRERKKRYNHKILNGKRPQQIELQTHTNFPIFLGWIWFFVWEKFFLFFIFSIHSNINLSFFNLNRRFNESWTFSIWIENDECIQNFSVFLLKFFLSVKLQNREKIVWKFVNGRLRAIYYILVLTRMGWVREFIYLRSKNGFNLQIG